MNKLREDFNAINIYILILKIRNFLKMESTLKRTRINAIINWWFGEGVDLDQPAPNDSFKRWYGGGPEVDAFIQSNFGPDLEKLVSGEYDWWKTDKEGLVACIILTDQFTRNIFRKKNGAFQYDHLAREFSASITTSKENFLSYKFQMLNFIVLPYEHSESLEDQQKALDLSDMIVEYAKTRPDTSEDIVKQSEAVRTFAKKHFDIIEKWGRFPHRNEVIGRLNTPEEEEYLKYADRFGQ